MAEFGELPFRYRLSMAAYRWRRIEPVPWTPLSLPLARARVALVTSAGLLRPGLDAPFHEARGGDPSVRWLPSDVSLAGLAIGQTSDAFDRTAIERDRNEALPLERLAEFADDGVIGAVAPRHLSFNGSMTAPGRFVAETAPQVAGMLLADAVQAALLVPV